ncbi:reverse transcriptase/maturase family protein [Sediminispirochaeta bajacaliforniensis]|uniref:reverse transcriptase/maturase family protein n=1 Tax=Sediminispirochaeta bajacaliforniensis TaxID=148 RepID=UPI000367E1FC|nr:RNA-dependent DNA polymerase [Sediminispirochaeta bajacaliforniensis]
MAKTYNNLYPQIYSFEALHEAYRKARKGKRYQNEVVRFTAGLEEELIQLQNELIWEEYDTSGYRLFTVHEPKTRVVASLPFRHRVVHHSIVSVIEPIWEVRFIKDSYACRPGKGTHAGADTAERMMRKVRREHGAVYALKADISKYFPSVDHEILKRLLRKRIACKPTLRLLDNIIDSYVEEGACRPRGIPIGNLTSQLFANIYLHELDKFVKYDLRERHYVRYMDDFVILHHDKQHLQDLRRRIEGFLQDRLLLHTNGKTQVFPLRRFGGRPLDFLGYRIWPTHRKLRKDSVKRMRKRLKRLAAEYKYGRIDIDRVRAAVHSWIAHSSHANTFRLRRQVMSEVVFVSRPSKSE